MMPDYLSCGTCHAEFDVVDFYRFLDHKVSNCRVRYYNGDQLTPCSAESVLECSKCLKKCCTPWALLQHLQSDHCMSLARTLLLPTDGAAGSYMPGGRQRSVDQTEMSEACTQTTRSCLKRQVCPYEEGLPDECCLKATKEQRASDRGCCCMDSYGVGKGGGCGSGTGCGSGGGGGGCGGGVSGGGIDRQTDCCLAVPKKRRLLTAVNGGNSTEPAQSEVGVTMSSSTSSLSAAAASATATDAQASECCGLKADCAMTRPAKRPTRTVECQTDFVVSLLDLDVDMLLDEAAVDVPTSLVSEIGGEDVPVIASPLQSSGLSPPTLAVSAALSRRPLHPAPSKAIQTVSRIALVPSTDYCSPPVALSMQYQQQPQEQHQQQQQQQQQQFQPQGHLALAQYQQPPTALPLPLPLPPLNNGGLDDAGDDVGRIGDTRVLIGQPDTRSSAPRPSGKELKFKCSQCPRTFRQNIHLRKHVMSQHSHSKPHKCPSCDYTTVEKSHLTVHIRKHTGERPYSCRDCNYSTAQNCTLKAHYLRKHPGSFVHCARCGLEFVTEHERDKHEKNCSNPV